MRKIGFVAFFYCVFYISCFQSASTHIHSSQPGETFQALLEEAINTSFESVPGVSMSISSDNDQLTWSGVSGFDSRKRENKMNVDQPFRIASVTKTFVAASILRLHELDSLSIDDFISDHISQQHIKILIEGGYDPGAIRVRHCLNHTSGLFDYAVGSQTYAEICLNNPTKRWTRTEQLEGAMQWGAKVGEPGERYFYSDSGYILLGEIIEKFFNGSLGKGIRSLLKFNEMGIDHTWLETLEDHPDKDKKPVSRYFRRDDVTAWDPSVDLYGGGGIVSITPDLTRFMHGLFNDQVFDHSGTLELMLSPTKYSSSYDMESDPRFKDYRLGLWKETLYGHPVYMHNGLWGIQLLHIPAYNSTVAINYTVGARDRLMKKTILAIKQFRDSE